MNLAPVTVIALLAEPKSVTNASSTPAVSCVDLAVHSAAPAKFEWSYWAAGGALLGGARRSAGASAGIGTELTLGLAQYRGFPSGVPSTANQAELRAGPWFAAATQQDGGLIEGGVKLHVGAVYHASWGTYELRAGAGYGAFPDGRAFHWAATFAWGVRSVPKRYTLRGFCDPVPERATFAEASIARLLVTYRRAFDDAGHQLLIGIELSPTFLLPPYGGARLSGGPVW